MKAAQRRLSALGLREAMPGIFGPVRQNKSRRPPGRLAPKDFDIGLPNHAGCPPTDLFEREMGRVSPTPSLTNPHVAALVDLI